MKGLATTSEKGQRIVEYLRKELDIPACFQTCSIHLDVKGIIKVDCLYFPKDDDES